MLLYNLHNFITSILVSLSALLVCVTVIGVLIISDAILYFVSLAILHPICINVRRKRLYWSVLLVMNGMAVHAV